MDEATKRELLDLVGRARTDAETEEGDFGAVLDLLGDLENAIQAGEVPPDLVAGAERASVRFPVLTRPRLKGASRSDVPAKEDSSLVQLRNKLKELQGSGS